MPRKSVGRRIIESLQELAANGPAKVTKVTRVQTPDGPMHLRETIMTQDRNDPAVEALCIALDNAHSDLADAKDTVHLRRIQQARVETLWLALSIACSDGKDCGVNCYNLRSRKNAEEAYERHNLERG